MKLFERHHWTCCDDNLAICGKDVRAVRADGEVAPNCRMCNILYDFPCRPGCDGADTWQFNPYILRGKKRWSVLTALKETTAKIWDALVSTNLRLRGFL